MPEPETRLFNRVCCGLLRFAAFNIGLLSGHSAFLGAGHFINHMATALGGPFSTHFKTALMFALTALLPMVLVAEEVNIRLAKLAIVSNSPLPPYAYFQAYSFLICSIYLLDAMMKRHIFFDADISSLFHSMDNQRNFVAHTIISCSVCCSTQFQATEKLL